MTHLNISEIKEETLFPGFQARIVHTERATIAFVTIDEGSELPEHSHENEQTLNLLEGKLELTVDGKRIVMNGGESIVLPSHVVHGGKALTRCRVQDIFVPRREDWINP